ncbi:MAG: glycine betaine ABC transporter substrate-binding protein, partial [Propionivibrio sp.]
MQIAGIAALLAGSQMAQAECGRVKVTNMNWQSAELLAEIDKIVLTEGYGCEVEVVLGDTMPTVTSMIEKGQPDVAPEVWINT